MIAPVDRTLGSLALLGIVLAVVDCGGVAPDSFPVLSGQYLGQTSPGTTPELFAPGIVSTGLYTRDLAITPDGREIYFSVRAGGLATIMQTIQVDGRWTEPEVAPFANDSRFLNIEPAISPDGSQFFFMSTRPPGGREPREDEIRSFTNQDLWVMDREGEHWGEPRRLDEPINSEDGEFFPSITRDGTLYFTRGGAESYIYRSRLIDGRYQDPVRLGPAVNSNTSQYNAFVAPDESYVIVCTDGRDDSFGGTDYYVAFRNPDDTWSGPVNLGPEVNTATGAQWSPYVSPDGRYFFFMSTRPRAADRIPTVLTAEFLRDLNSGPEGGNPSMYWMDASFIQGLRPPAAGTE